MEVYGSRILKPLIQKLCALNPRVSCDTVSTYHLKIGNVVKLEKRTIDRQFIHFVFVLTKIRVDFIRRRKPISTSQSYSVSVLRRLLEI